MGKKLKKGGTRNTDEAQNTCEVQKLTKPQDLKEIEKSIKAEKEAEIQQKEDISGLDERSMIREQDRLAREKKKRKNRKKKRIGSAVVLVILAGGVWYFFWGRNLLVREEETSVQITASAGQEIQYARLTGIKGNEITYILAEALESHGDINSDGGAFGESDRGMQGTVSSGDNVRPESGVSKSRRPESGGSESGRLENDGSEGGNGRNGGEMPSGGEMPDMGGEMPSGGEMPDMGGEMPSGGIPDMSHMGGNTTFEGRGGSINTFTYDGVTYQLTDEIITAQIPVGTDVTTKLGTVTTFSRLASGDCVALVTEKAGEERIIVAVYIIG